MTVTTTCLLVGFIVPVSSLLVGVGFLLGRETCCAPRLRQLRDDQRVAERQLDDLGRWARNAIVDEAVRHMRPGCGYGPPPTIIEGEWEWKG